MPRANQERSVRIEHAAEHAARVSQQRHQVLRSNHDAAQHVIVAGQVLGRAVHDQVDAELQGTDS